MRNNRQTNHNDHLFLSFLLVFFFPLLPITAAVDDVLNIVDGGRDVGKLDAAHHWVVALARRHLLRRQ